ncbi:hypothetical protein CQW23_31452 [Capsicum baccatum]|uniref:Uncharacterized protein n=1 Tax=Capsicum baccatum TaxID=33114 RepID=A0A2G2V7N8_CAPBA|nr:hypothetical protein CQW23_31452 [Capsicum baccatum]
MLDISSSAFTGNLQMSLFQHFRAMMIIDPSKKGPSDEGDGYYQNSIAVVTKGLEHEVVRILFLYTTIDLSNNKFEGHIPSMIGELIALHILNLSYNGLQGPTPQSLGILSSVESLDLPGECPKKAFECKGSSLETVFANMRIWYPALQIGVFRAFMVWNARQFHTFENNSYEGNDGLCGFPLSKGCGNDGHDSASEKTYAGSALDEESNSEFVNDFLKATLMGYGTRLCIGLSIIYFLISTGNMKCLERIVEELEHNIMMARRKSFC